jgi:predicted transcriptional regulator
MTGKGRFLVQGIVVILLACTILTYAFLTNEATAAGAPDKLDDSPDSQNGVGGIDGGTNYYVNESAGIDEDRGFFGDGLPWEFGLAAFVLGSSATLATLYARLSTEDVLEGIRKEIYEHIEHNPGDHLAGITKRFGISSSSVRHHLDVLEWSEMIVSHKAEKLRHYYPNRNGYRIYTNGLGYKEIMAVLHNKTTREMVKFLMVNERANQIGIAQALNLHASTVNWHAKRLIAAQVITRTKEGKDIHYNLNTELDVARVIALIEGDDTILDGAAPVIEGASS